MTAMETYLDSIAFFEKTIQDELDRATEDTAYEPNQTDESEEE